MRGVMEAGADSSVTQRGYRGVEARVSDTSSAQGQGGQTSGLADGETGEERDEALGEEIVRTECVLYVCVYLHDALCWNQCDD